MARLDDAGMHRSDRNLVDAVALDLHERVVIDGKWGRVSGMVGIGQWVKGGRPRRMAQPRSLIRIRAVQPGQIGNGTLHAACARKPLFKPRITGFRSSQSQRQYEHTRIGPERGAHEMGATGVATGPE